MASVMSTAILQLLQQSANLGSAQMEAMRASTQSQMQAMQAIVEASRPRGDGEMVKLLTAVSPLLAPLIDKLFSRRDPVELATEMIDKLTPKGQRDTPAVGALKEVIELVKEVVEAKDILGGASVAEPPDPMSRLIDGIMKMVEVTTARVPGAAPGAGTVVPVAPGTALTSPGGDAAGGAQPMWMRMLATYVPRLQKLASEGRDPEMYAEVTVDQIPEGVKGYLREFVARETAVEEVLAAFPQLRTYEVWTRQFFTTVQSILLPTDDGEDGDGEEEEREEHEGRVASGRTRRGTRKAVGSDPEPPTDTGD
jgi:hypothetical protein